MRTYLGFGWAVLLACAACSPAPTRQLAGGNAGGAGGGSSVGTGGAGGSAGSAAGAEPIQLAGQASVAPVELPLGADCDPTRTVASDSAALIVRDPEVLARFDLERVLRQIITTAQTDIPPLELLQRLFDSNNDTASATFADALHCDSPNNTAFKASPAVACPRVEGRLANSPDLLTPDAVDGFVPIALVNRFDLLPSTLASCGEYRIVYAKRSGRTDPADRVFLSFEAALANPQRSLVSCRPVAELWASLANATLADRAERLDELFFTGLPGLPAIIDAAHYGLGASHCGYSGACGQVRVAQGMQAPFEFRQFSLQKRAYYEPGPSLWFPPVPVDGALKPASFDAIGEQGLLGFVDGLDQLLASDVARIGMHTWSTLDAGESAVAGEAAPNYWAHAMQSPELAAAEAAIAQQVAEWAPEACRGDDALDRDAAFQRLSALSCAGCHAPDEVLTTGRRVGCGGVWPLSLGHTHIDEQGELSPALKEVFLPHRAAVLQTFLQACDNAAVQANLQPFPGIPRVECFPAGTPITLANGQTRAIEQISAGDWVLSYEQSSHTLAPARVVRRIVRPFAERFVSINGRLLATDNHPFFADGRWVRADALALGARLFELRDAEPSADARFELSPVAVTELAESGGPVTTYNLEVAEYHSYFAAGLLVHDRP